MSVVFFVLSLTAVVVLFGSIIASLAWLILWTLRSLVRLLAKLSNYKGHAAQHGGRRSPVQQ